MTVRPPVSAKDGAIQLMRQVSHMCKGGKMTDVEALTKLLIEPTAA